MRFEKLPKSGRMVAWARPSLTSAALSNEEVKEIVEAEDPRDALVAAARRHGLIACYSFADFHQASLK